MIETLPSPPSKVEKRVSSRYFEVGFYEHYKGGIYYAVAVAEQTETEARVPVVMYFSLDQAKWFTRPEDDENHASFLDDVRINGEWRPRFKNLNGVDILVMGILEKYLATARKAEKER